MRPTWDCLSLGDDFFFLQVYEEFGLLDTPVLPSHKGRPKLNAYIYYYDITDHIIVCLSNVNGNLQKLYSNSTLMLFTILIT